MDINVLYCIDEMEKDYSRHLGVSIFSLLENNQSHNITLYIISKIIDDGNKAELKRIAGLFHTSIIFSEGEIVSEDIQKMFQLDNLGIPAFYRLFYKNCFPQLRDGKLLYLDCDTIITGDISRIYSCDLGDNLLAGNLDVPYFRYIRSKQIGINYREYINSGVLLFNISEFNEVDVGKEIREINKKITLFSADQDYINLMTLGRRKIEEMQIIVHKKFGLNLNKVPILHTVYVPYGRYSRCPKKVIKLYRDYLEKTKWKNYNTLNEEKSLRKLLGLCYRVIRDYFDWLVSFFGDRAQVVNYFVFKWISMFMLFCWKFVGYVMKITQKKFGKCYFY